MYLFMIRHFCFQIIIFKCILYIKFSTIFLKVIFFKVRTRSLFLYAKYALYIYIYVVYKLLLLLLLHIFEIIIFSNKQTGKWFNMHKISN
jgi:hypothetical protein